MRSHYSDELSRENDGESVSLAGWIQDVRDLGKLSFYVIRDRGGLIQAVCKKGETPPDAQNTLKSATKESVIIITGLVRANEKAPRGIEISPQNVQILSESAAVLPIEVTGKVESDMDTRLNNRFMDLRKPRVSAIFRIRSRVLAAYRDFFIRRGYVEINPPSIISAASEGGTNLFPITYFEKEAFLCQSPQLYKQMMMATGLDRVFITQPVFRAEPHATPRHLNEIYMLDAEIAFIKDEEDVMRELEGVVQHMIRAAVEDCQNEMALLGRNIEVPKLPFKRLEYGQALELLSENNMPLEWGDDIPPEGEKMLHELLDAPFFIKRWPTDIRAFYSRPIEDDPKICGAFDLDYMGLELSSGAQRIHNHDQLVDALLRNGLEPANFEFYLKAFRYGMPPHGGWGLGLERMVSAICNLANVRECVLFPRDRNRVEP